MVPLVAAVRELGNMSLSTAKMIVVVGAGIAGLVTSSWVVVGAVGITGGALFWAVVHRLWKNY